MHKLSVTGGVKEVFIRQVHCLSSNATYRSMYMATDKVKNDEMDTGNWYC